MYKVRLTKSAAKELGKLPNDALKRIADRIDGLAEDPRPRGSKKLKGQKGFWRLRVGDYRVIYSIDDSIEIVDVVRIGHRKDIYR